MDKKTKNRFGILIQVLLAFFIAGSALIAFTFFIIRDGMINLEESFITDHLNTDFNYVAEIVGAYSNPNYNRESDLTWELVDNDRLYCFGEYIASISESKLEEKPADQSPLYERLVTNGNKTGITSYILIKDVNQQDSGDVGHYIRALGSTKGNKGETIVGTYITKNVSDALDAGQDYLGNADVMGRPMRCIYKPIKDINNEVIGSLVVGRNTADIDGAIRHSLMQTQILVWVFILLSLAGLTFFIAKSVKNIKKINSYLNVIARGKFPEKPLVIKTKSELADVADSVNAMVVSLKEKERIGAELSVATSIQADMLPSIFPPFPDHNEFDIYASMDPAKEVGGDFYDFFMVDDTHVAVVIGDVSGKGVPAALFMVTAKTLIKDHAQLGLEPYEVFTKVNQILCSGNKEGLFVTCWMGILDIKSGKLRFTNAGHNPPLLYSNGKYEFLKSRAGFVLAGLDTMVYRQNEIDIKPGDRLFLYTDGVTEATNINKELYGEDRLINFMNSNSNRSIQDVCVTLRDDVDYFVGKAEQFDDITMLLLEFKTLSDNFVDKVLEAKVENLAIAMEFIEEEMEKAGVGPKEVMQVAVAFEEMFVNVCHYAYGNRTGDVKVSVFSKDNNFIIKIKDSGIPFNPLEHLDPDITLSAQDRQIGGLGILMVKKTMDDIQYEYADGMNVLTIIKKY